jgi:UDP-N-acetylmuramoyl-L-alanyl-D-glutamate--2,6-diaminopimelate ligase
MQLHTPTQAAQWLGSHVRGTLRSDSRQLQPGDGFIAWPGAATDGRKFVASALAKGAGACLVEHEGVAAFGLGEGEVATYAGLKSDTGTIASEFFGYPSRELDVIAITGTNGKTSTAWWLAQALDRARRPAGMIGTLGVGRPPSALVSTGLTTPDPVQVQQSLRSFVDQGLSACAMEASSIGIEEHRLDGTDIRVAIFTNFSQDHMDYHGSMDAYWESKRRLFDWHGLRSMVVNLDDVRGVELAQSLKERTSSAPNPTTDLWTISCQRDARLIAKDIHHAVQGVRFTVAEGGETHVLQTRVIGSYNVSNLLGVVAALRSLGVTLADAVQACADLLPVPGRMDCVGALGQPLVAVDYAHTPDALAHALAALRPLVQARGGQLWCVFGCGGDRDAAKRPLMGAIAAKLADRVVVTSDNPRGEKPEAIIAQILLGLPQCASVQVQSDRAVAIAQTVGAASNSDVVLLAGKGHEHTQEVAGTKTPFSDIDHARQALALRGIAPEVSA